MAICRKPEFSRRRNAAATSSSLPSVPDMCGSSDADTDMPKRLTGSK